MKKKYQELIDQLGKDRVEKNTLLKNHTTFGIGGPADLFYETKTTNELIKAVKLARKLKVPYFLLGGGSNVLAADKGFGGLIIKNRARQIKKLKNNRLQVASGTSNQELVSFCQKQGLSGVEFLAGIPGTLGGSLAVNAGTPQEPFFGGSISDVVKKLTLILPSGKVKRVSKKWMEFGYRTSKIKRAAAGKKPTILSAIFQLEESSPEDIQKVVETKIEKRKTTQPWGFSAGSVFKNPESNYAGMLIDKSGLKGRWIGGAKISEKHANFIINENSATAKNVFELIKLIKKEVKKKFGVNLKEEIDLVGF